MSDHPGKDGVAPWADWRSVGASEHVVQFYEEDVFLLDAVKDFIGASLRAGDAGIVIMTPAHREGLETRLRAEGMDLAEAGAAGLYVALDAGDTLANLLVDGTVDPGRFKEVIGGVIARAGAGRPRVRVFGELVALLAAAANHPAAIRLEGLWNDLLLNHTFTLLCGYSMDSLSGEEFAGVLGDICAAHSQVIPAESYTILPTLDAQLRAITILQQQARSLEAALAAEGAARAAAEEALRVRDDFLSIAAHELKTPITALSGQTQLLLRRLRHDRPLDREQLAPALTTLSGQTERLTRLISHMLDMSNLEAGTLTLEPQATDLTVLVERAVARAGTWSDRHTITVAAPPSLEAWADPARLEQVLFTLLDNALTYSPEGGPVEVVLVRAESDRVELAVRDWGLGIPAEKRGRIFERFYQAHRDGHRGGLGLGLYISRQIVVLHGGDIRAEFPADGGMRFAASLPLGPS